MASIMYYICIHIIRYSVCLAFQCTSFLWSGRLPGCLPSGRETLTESFVVDQQKVIQLILTPINKTLSKLDNHYAMQKIIIFSVHYYSTPTCTIVSLSLNINSHNFVTCQYVYIHLYYYHDLIIEVDC